MKNGSFDLPFLLRGFGAENVTSILVEGGGETNATFLEAGLVQRVAFFYAPLVIGGRNAPVGVGGKGVRLLRDRIALGDESWRRVGVDLFLSARVNNNNNGSPAN